MNGNKVYSIEQTNRLNKLRSCNGSQLIDNSPTPQQITSLANNLVSSLTSSPPNQASPQTQLQLVGLNNLTNSLNVLPSNQLTPAPSPQDHCILNGSNSSSSSGLNAASLLLNNSTNNLTTNNNLTNNNVLSTIAALAAAQSQSSPSSNYSTQQQLLKDALNSLATRNGSSPSLSKSDSLTTNKTNVGKSKCSKFEL